MNGHLKKIVLILSFTLMLGLFIIWLFLPSRYLLTSSAELSSGRVANAVNILEKGYEKYPDNTDICFNLAKAYLQVGEVELANEIVFSKKSQFRLMKKSAYYDFLVNLAESNYQLGNQKTAKLFAMKYLEYEQNKKPSKWIAKNLISLGKILPEMSIELWEKAFNISYALKDSELKESIKALLLPKYFQHAEDLKLQKKYLEALSALKKSEIVGKNAEIDFREAVIYHELMETDLTQEKFEEAIQLDPNNDNYKISYSVALKDIALATKDKAIKNEYFEKIKLLLSSVEDSPRKISLLNKIINLNAKYKITNVKLKVTKLGDFFYPSLVFKIDPISDTILQKYKIVFSDVGQNTIDEYESPITNEDIKQEIEVICRNPVDSGNLVSAKVFVNDEFIKEFTNK